MAPAASPNPDPVQKPTSLQRPWWKRWGRRLLKTAIILYLGACLILYFFQSWLIFPGAYVHGRKAATVLPAPGREMVALHTAGGRPVAAVFGAALDAGGAALPDAAARPTLLYFYGNGDCIKTSMQQFADFRRLGFNVMIPEYVGYPMSGGSPSEAGMYDTADAAYAWLLTRPEVDPRRIVIVGRSIGGGPAIDLASRRPVAGLAVFSAFTSMDDMARKVLPMFPTRLFLHTHFDNERKIADVKCPIFFAHGTVDSLVPFAMMARLANRATQPVTLVPVPGANHNDIFLIGGRPLLSSLAEFVNRLPPESEAPPRRHDQAEAPAR